VVVPPQGDAPLSIDLPALDASEHTRSPAVKTTDADEFTVAVPVAVQTGAVPFLASNIPMLSSPAAPVAQLPTVFVAVTQARSPTTYVPPAVVACCARPLEPMSIDPVDVDALMSSVMAAAPMLAASVRTTLAARNPASVNVQVVLAVVQVSKSKVVGAVANPNIVFVVVAALPKTV